MTNGTVSGPDRSWRASLQRTLLVLLGVALVVGVLWAPVDNARTGVVMAGRNYSSGRFSFGKSGFSGGRGFPSGGKSYSSGGSRPSFSGGRPSYSSGSRTAPSFGPPKSSPSVPFIGKPTYTAPPPRLGGKQYSSGTRTAPAGPGPGTGPSYDVGAGRALQQQESRETYRRYTSPGKSGSWGPPVVPSPQPRPSYTDNSGTQRPIDPRDARIDELRRQLDYERWANRRQREEEFYHSWWSTPVITYHDAYNPFFDYWLLRQNAEIQALWLYNHRDTMDQQRYQDLLRQNAELKNRVEKLEGQNKPRDPTYTPPGISPDLMYNDSYVDSAYNPQRPHTNPWLIVATVLAVGLLIGFVVWLVFVHRWGGTSAESSSGNEDANAT